jgi:hypothetical protein
MLLPTGGFRECGNGRTSRAPQKIEQFGLFIRAFVGFSSYADHAARLSRA